MQKKIEQVSYYKWLVFGVTAIGTFMSTLDSSIVNVALPIIAEDLNTNLSVVQWVVTAYLLATSSSLPAFGRLGDMMNRRTLYGSGFLIFTIGSLLCAIAANIWFLVLARVIQALGASIMMSNAPAIITAVFPHTQRGQALGMVGTIVALGSMTGPSVGGILVGLFGWHSIFLINLPIGLLGYVCSQYILPVQEVHNRESFDYLGALLFTISMISLLVGISNAQSWGPVSLPTIISFLTAIVGFALFYRYEAQTTHPMINIALFRNRIFFAGNLAGMLSFMASFSNVMLLPFYLHTIVKLPPEQIGLILTAFPVTMAIVAPLSGYFSDRIGPSILAVAGLSIMMVALAVLAYISNKALLWQIVLILAAMGLGNGMFQSPNNSSVMSSLPLSQHGLAGSMTAMVRNVGMVFGTAIAVSIHNYKQAVALAGIAQPSAADKVAAFMSGYQSALLMGAVFAGLGALLSVQRLRLLQDNKK